MPVAATDFHTCPVAEIPNSGTERVSVSEKGRKGKCPTEEAAWGLPVVAERPAVFG
jgi:hypothetical protein